MSAVGFDFGTESCVVAVAKGQEVEVVFNDELNRETPSVVCFAGNQRVIGVAEAMRNDPQNTITQIKTLLGRQFSDPEIQRRLKSLPFLVTEGHDGFPLINMSYLGEFRSFSPTQVLGMLFSHLKSVAEKHLNAAVTECCIGIPTFFTDVQRRAVLDAATIAGLQPLRLIHETTATALVYGFYKNDLPEDKPKIIVIVDIGHSSMQVSIAGLRKAHLQILAHSFDLSLGGHDFDELLFQHFAVNFKEEYKIDVFQNVRACFRLRAACGKLKMALTVNAEAPLNIEYLVDGEDVKGSIKREEFMKICLPTLERVKKVLEKALAEAGLPVDGIHAVEVVGSGSRIPIVMEAITKFFQKHPCCTMNSSVSVAKGCALQCAILGSSSKVRVSDY